MFYKRVYSPDGQPFDVPTSRANDLILQKGWTQQPVVEEKSEKTPTPKKIKTKTSRRKKSAPVEEIVEPVEELVEDTAEEFPFTFGEEPTTDIDD